MYELDAHMIFVICLKRTNRLMRAEVQENRVLVFPERSRSDRTVRATVRISTTTKETHLKKDGKHGTGEADYHTERENTITDKKANSCLVSQMEQLRPRRSLLRNV